jgi:Peptidase family M50
MQEARLAAADDRTDSLDGWILIVVSLCIAVVLICASVLTHDYWIPALFASSALGLAAGIVCHEFGHMLCAVLLSLPVRLVSIGCGPLLWRGRIGETRFELHAVPWSGLVRCYPQPVIRRLPMLFFVLGGVLGNAALIGVVAAVDAADVVPHPMRIYLGPIVLAQIYLIVTNLAPYWGTVGGIAIVTDGLLFLLLLAGPRSGPTQDGLLYAAMLDRYRGANRAAPRRACVRLIYQLLRCDRWTDAEARRDFQDAVQRELGRGALSREETILALDALVTNALIYRDPPLRAQLDAWSQQALRLAPDSAALRGSRGAVLVELGRYQEGRALLAPLVGAQPAASFDAFMVQVFLARAERALGDIAAARALAAAARENAAAVRDIPEAAFMLSQLDAELATSSGQPGNAAYLSIRSMSAAL